MIYEVVWLHLLRLTLGVSTYSLGVVLAVFMGGMALGSLFFGWLVSRKRHPLKVYAILEWGIGVFGIAMPYILPAASAVYVSVISWHEGSALVRVLVAITVLLPPTILMGATLPAISRFVSKNSDGAIHLGWIYAANIFGAVCGSLLAGIVLMRYFDARVASFVAAAINGTVGTVAWRLAGSKFRDWQPDVETTFSDIQPRAIHNDQSRGHFIIVAAVLGCSGMAALGAEVIWTRLLTLSFGPTVYSFALVLAVFLAGLGIGSAIASAMLSKIDHPLLGLGFCQLALLFAIPLGALSFADRSLNQHSVWMLSAIADWPATAKDFVRCFMTVFPSALFWGASFPLAVAAVFNEKGDKARTVGMLSAANTIGAIVGAIVSSFVLVPLWGTHVAQQNLVMISAVAAGLCFGGYSWVYAPASAGYKNLQVFLIFAGMIALGLLGTWYVEAPAPALFAYGREAAQRRHDAPILVVREGVRTPIVVTFWPKHNNVRALHLEGKLEASDDKIDLRMERMLGHIPQFICRHPRKVLVVGLGAGITSGSFIMDERTEELVICELEPDLPPIIAEHFAGANRNVLEDPRTKLIIDDGRHYLQTTDLAFDIISVDPIHPWVHGAAALYSEEFLAQCLRHLTPGGVVSYWVPMHSMTTASVKTELATFCKVFPYALVWHTGGTMSQRHMLVVGSNEPQIINLEEVDQIAPPGSAIEESVREMEFESVDDMLTLYVADKQSLKEWLVGAEINSDLSLRLEYLAGAAAFQNERETIFREVIAHRTWPQGLYQGEQARLDAIKSNLAKYDEIESPDSQPQ